MKLAQMIKACRKKRDLTLDQLAEQTGVSKSTISQVENGNTTPKVDVVLKLSEFFECSTDYLIKGEDYKSMEVCAGIDKIGVINEQMNDREILNKFFALVEKYQNDVQKLNEEIKKEKDEKFSILIRLFEEKNKLYA